MRKLLVLFLFLFVTPLFGADRNLTLTREMLEDTIIRNDAEGMRLARERLLRIIAESDDRLVLRDAHYLVALEASFQSFSGAEEPGALASLTMTGIRHADRAIELDPRFADGWMLSSWLRGSARRSGLTVPPDPAGAPNRFQHALELDARSPGTAFFSAAIRSFNPAGAAPPEGVKMFEELVARLEADRLATGRRFGLWDAEAAAWMIFVRRAQDDPRAEVLRPMAARLLEQRPDFALGQQIAEAAADHKFAALPALTWQPLLSDPAGDGSNPKLPDVVAVDRAEHEDRLWYRVTFHDPLPRSFGVNLVFDRDGDPSTGMRWWGNGSTFRFDRLVTAWISRDGDHYFGTVGVTDDAGAGASQLTRITTDVLVAMGSDGRSVIVGVPRNALGLTAAATMIAAGGSHLVWNDDATSVVNSR